MADPVKCDSRCQPVPIVANSNCHEKDQYSQGLASQLTQARLLSLDPTYIKQNKSALEGACTSLPPYLEIQLSYPGRVIRAIQSEATRRAAFWVSCTEIASGKGRLTFQSDGHTIYLGVGH